MAQRLEVLCHKTTIGIWLKIFFKFFYLSAKITILRLKIDARGGLVEPYAEQRCEGNNVRHNFGLQVLVWHPVDSLGKEV